MVELGILKDLMTKHISLDSDRKPIPKGSDKDEFYCGGCDRFTIEEGCICSLISERKLKEDIIKHIKHLRRSDRMNIYQANIDEKSLIPWMMRYFSISEEDLK